MEVFRNVMLVLVGCAFLEPALAEDSPAQDAPAAGQGPAAASGPMMKMEDGTALEDAMMFSDVLADMVKIKKKKDASDTAGEMKCMGVIFSSLVIFTSMYCEVSDADKDMWMIEPVKPATLMIQNVVDGRHKNDFKRIDLVLPGLIMSENSEGPMAAPFNMNPDDEMLAQVVVFAFEDKAKACAVSVVETPDECQKLYASAVTAYPNAGLPAEFTDSIKCGIKGTGSMNLTMTLGGEMKKMEIAMGMPCDDSLGSAVASSETVFGIVIRAFCGDTKLVLIQPSTKGLSMESYTESSEMPSESTKEYQPTVTDHGDHYGTGPPSNKIPSKPISPDRSKTSSSTRISGHLQSLTVAALFTGATQTF